jgi:hypothetical protein
MFTTINVYSKTIEPMTQAELDAIRQAVLKAGFEVESLETSFEGCKVIAVGAYYGKAVEAINELGYQTDEDEIDDDSYLATHYDN